MQEIPFPFKEEPKRTVQDIAPPTFAQMHKLEAEELPLKHRKLDKLKDWHCIMAEMQVMGWKATKIAEELGDHIMSVMRVQRDPIYKVFIADLRKQAQENSTYDVAAHLARVTEKTFTTLEELMEHSESDNVRVTAAKEFADRISPKVSKVEADVKNVIYLESDTLQMLAENLKQSCNLDPALLDGKTDEEIIDILEAEVEGDVNAET